MAAVVGLLGWLHTNSALSLWWIGAGLGAVFVLTWSVRAWVVATEWVDLQWRITSGTCTTDDIAWLLARRGVATSVAQQIRAACGDSFLVRVGYPAPHRTYEPGMVFALLDNGADADQLMTAIRVGFSPEEMFRHFTGSQTVSWDTVECLDALRGS